MTRAEDNKKKIKHLEQVKSWVKSLTADEKKECDVLISGHVINSTTGVLEFFSVKPSVTVVRLINQFGKKYMQQIKIGLVTRESLVAACANVSEAASKETGC